MADAPATDHRLLPLRHRALRDHRPHRRASSTATARNAGRRTVRRSPPTPTCETDDIVFLSGRDGVTEYRVVAGQVPRLLFALRLTDLQPDDGRSRPPARPARHPRRTTRAARRSHTAGWAPRRRGSTSPTSSRSSPRAAAQARRADADARRSHRHRPHLPRRPQSRALRGVLRPRHAAGARLPQSCTPPSPAIRTPTTTTGSSASRCGRHMPARPITIPTHPACTTSASASSTSAPSTAPRPSCAPSASR